MLVEELIELLEQVALNEPEAEVLLVDYDGRIGVEANLGIFARGHRVTSIDME